MKKKQTNKLGIVIVGILLLSCISAFIIPVEAVDYKTEGTYTVGWGTPGGHEVTLGDQFTARIWVDATGAAPYNYTGAVLYNLSWADEQPGIINATLVANGNSVIWVTYDAGTIRNATGNISNSQAGRLGFGNVTGNYSLFNITFDTISCGFAYLNFTYVTKFSVQGIEIIDDVGAPIAGVTFNNNTVTVYPQQPAAIGATAYNYTIINLTFTPGTGGNTTTLCGKAGSYPADPTDSVIYNGTNTSYNHTSLTDCTTYYYRAWTWNATHQLHSETYRQTYETTQCHTNFTFMGVNPVNGSGTENCTYDITVNVTINNSRGHIFNWWINGSDGSVTGGIAMANDSFDLVMAGLNHNQTYYWNVTVSDAEGHPDNTNVNYWFVTGRGGGTAPATPGTPFPTSGTTSESINVGTLTVDVTDPDGDNMNVSFYWSNGAYIGTDTNVPSGGTATIAIGALNYNQTYWWNVTANDTCLSTRGPGSGAYWFFITDTAELTINKDCEPSITNASIRYIINVTNTGEVNLTNIVINETLDSNVQWWRSYPTNDTGGLWWTIPFLNMSNSTSFVVWVNVSTMANGTTVSNSVNVSNNTGVQLDSATCGPYTICLSSAKRINGTTIGWNTTWVNYTINITNCGDIFLENVTVNESYSINITYQSSNLPANITGQSFNIGDLAPGATTTLYVRTKTSYAVTGDILINTSRVYNNITVKTNQTTPEVSLSTYTTVGARTETIRITYQRDIPDLLDLGNRIFAIIGMLLILGSIFIILYIMRRGEVGPTG